MNVTIGFFWPEGKVMVKLQTEVSPILLGEKTIATGSDGHPFSGFYFFPQVCSSVPAKLKYLREPNFDIFFSKRLSVLKFTRIIAFLSSAREN